MFHHSVSGTTRLIWSQIAAVEKKTGKAPKVGKQDGSQWHNAYQVSSSSCSLVDSVVARSSSTSSKISSAGRQMCFRPMERDREYSRLLYSWKEYTNAP